MPKPYPKEFRDDVANVARNREPGQHLKQIAAGPLWQDHDLVFAQADGRPIERKSAWRAW